MQSENVNGWEKSLYWLTDTTLLALLMGYGSVALLLAAGTTFNLRILPTLALGVVTVAAVAWAGRGRFALPPTQSGPGEGRSLVAVIVAGVAARVGAWLVLSPQPFSDFVVYFRSAEHLVRYGAYRVPETEGLLIAYRPPGTAFLHAMAMKALGVVAWAPLALNCVLFAATSWLLWHAVRDRVTRTAALGTVVLLAFWPSDVLYASFAQSESPSLVGVALLMYLLAKRGERLGGWSAAAGLTTGLLCLVRSSNLLLVPVWMLAAVRERVGWPVRLRYCALITITVMLPILPWTYRNYLALGEPVLISTNGGENLYSANNPWSGGSWDETSSRRARELLPDELKMDRTAKQWAIEWIRSNPRECVKLAVNKLRILMSTDDQGVYHVIERGSRCTGPGVLVARAVANAWWVLLWGLVFTCIRLGSPPGWGSTGFAVLALAAVPALLFLLFQSQPRYHVPMVPPLLALAGRALASRRSS